MSNQTAQLNKTIVITGATSGIGFASAAELAGRGARIIGVGRSQARCGQAEAAIKAMHPGSQVSFITADLSSLRQVRNLAAEIQDRLKCYGKNAADVLINNAGTVSGWYVSTVDGFELQFAVNHLAPFLLTNQLLPLLGESQQARVIMVSSGSHYRTRIHWKDVMLKKHYNCLWAYKQTKLANVMFASELNRRLPSGSNIRAYAVDPGLVNTSIGLKGTSGLVSWVWKKRSRQGIKPEKAAETIAYLASVPEIPFSDAIYWKECKPAQPSPYSQREDMASRLWELSGRLCGLKPMKAGVFGSVDGGLDVGTLWRA